MSFEDEVNAYVASEMQKAQRIIDSGYEKSLESLRSEYASLQEKLNEKGSLLDSRESDLNSASKELHSLDASLTNTINAAADAARGNDIARANASSDLPDSAIVIQSSNNMMFVLILFVGWFIFLRK